VGDYVQAQRVASRAAARAAGEPNRPALVDALRVQAMIATRQGQWQEAAAALDEALSLSRGMPYPYAEAKALYVSGLLHAAREQPQPARERFEAALAILNQLGERLYAEHIERTLAEMVPS
jgi:tetratricopeptide (TPR) repeat protein